MFIYLLDTWKKFKHIFFEFTIIWSFCHHVVMSNITSISNSLFKEHFLLDIHPQYGFSQFLKEYNQIRKYILVNLNISAHWAHQ